MVEFGATNDIFNNLCTYFYDVERAQNDDDFLKFQLKHLYHLITKKTCEYLNEVKGPFSDTLYDLLKSPVKQESGI